MSKRETSQPQEPKSSGLVLLDFRASWCVQCDVQSELLRRLTNITQDQVRVEHVDIDNEPERTKQYEVHEVPTLVLCRGTKVISRLVGTQPYSCLVSFIKSALSSQPRLGNGTV